MHACMMNSSGRSKSVARSVMRRGHILSRLWWPTLGHHKPKLAINFNNMARINSSKRDNLFPEHQYSGEDRSSLIADGESLLSNGTHHNNVVAAATSSPRIPKGFLAVYVGPELRRFVIPACYLSMPDMRALMDGAAEEFGYHHQGGGIRIPNCDEYDFEHILTMCLAMHQTLSKEGRHTEKTYNY